MEQQTIPHLKTIEEVKYYAYCEMWQKLTGIKFPM